MKSRVMADSIHPANPAIIQIRAMEYPHHQHEQSQSHLTKVTGVKWFREWVPQETVPNSGKCFLLKWVTEDALRTIKEKQQEEEEEEEEQEPESPHEVLFLCSYEGCGKTFAEAGALKKHSHVHGERQHICHYEGCGRKFLDSSKLKRHFLIHTGEKHFTCPHEGCGKAFSLDFNLRAHMRTHSQENYHICPFEDCGKRYAHEYKLKAHIKSQHEKNLPLDVKLTPPQAGRECINPKVGNSVYGSVHSDRPFACPYDGCDKCYIHEYKLNLHLRREHAGYTFEENGRHASEVEDEMEEGSDQDANLGKVGNNITGSSRGKLRIISKATSAARTHRKSSNIATVDLNMKANPRTFMEIKGSGKEDFQEDSEETEEDHEDTEDEGWGCETELGMENDDDEETEDDMD